jgi:hypothetical protein
LQRLLSLFVDIGYQGTVPMSTLNIDAINSWYLKDCLPPAFPAAAISKILKLPEQGNNFPVRLVSNVLQSAIQLLKAGALSLVPVQQIGFNFGDKLGVAFLYRNSQRAESVPDRSAEFTVGHVSSVCGKQSMTSIISQLRNVV